MSYCRRWQSCIYFLLQVLLLSHPKKDIRDTSEYEPLRRFGLFWLQTLSLWKSTLQLCFQQSLLWKKNYYIRGGQKRALKHLAAEILGAKIQENEHCPVSINYVDSFCSVSVLSSWNAFYSSQAWYSSSSYSHLFNCF